MQQIEKALALASLHIKGAPLAVINAWDVGSARAIAAAGAKVVATSSWAVAAAQGFEDGEALPFEAVRRNAEAMARAVEVPVSVDFEGGYSTEPAVLACLLDGLLDAGIAGINFEDRVVGGSGLHAIEEQSARIRVIRARAESRGVPLFINARCDVFFGQGFDSEAAKREACRRAAAFAAAGASGFFLPGLNDLPTITALVRAIELPLNVMVLPGLPTVAELAAAGVARISHGPAPYLSAMRSVQTAAEACFA